MNARSNPSSRFRALVVVAALAGWHATGCSTALAHNGETPPTPPAMSPVAVNIKEVPPPPRWTWIYWWEANRDRFLTTPSQSARSVQEADPAQLEKLRAAAAQELVRAVEAGNGALAAEAAMALGKMHHAPSLATLKTLVDRAEAARGRVPVVLGMGLLGSPEAEAALVAYRPPRVEDEAAPLAAIGLLPTIQESTLRVLRKGIDSNQPGTATAACFALRQHHDKNNVAYYRGLLRSNESTWVASEALLGMGKTHEREAVDLLEHVLFGDPAASRDVMAWGTLTRMREQRVAAAQAADSRDRYNKAFEGYKREFERWKARNPNTKFDKNMAGRKEVVDGGDITVGEEFRELAWLRSSAAIALGEAAQPRAGEVLLTFISPTRRDTDVYLVAPKGFAVMSLAEYPTEATCNRFIALLGKRDDG